MLGKLLDIEHLNRVVQFNAEVAELSALTSRVVAAPASAQGEQKSSAASAVAQTSATCTTEQLLAAGVGTASMAAAAAVADKGPRSGLNGGQDVGAEQLQAGTAVQAGPSAAQAASAKQDIFQVCYTCKGCVHLLVVFHPPMLCCLSHVPLHAAHVPSVWIKRPVEWAPIAT